MTHYNIKADNVANFQALRPPIQCTGIQGITQSTPELMFYCALLPIINFFNFSKSFTNESADALLLWSFTLALRLTSSGPNPLLPPNLMPKQISEGARHQLIPSQYILLIMKSWLCSCLVLDIMRSRSWNKTTAGPFCITYLIPVLVPIKYSDSIIPVQDTLYQSVYNAKWRPR